MPCLRLRYPNPAFKLRLFALGVLNLLAVVGHAPRPPCLMQLLRRARPPCPDRPPRPLTSFDVTQLAIHCAPFSVTPPRPPCLVQLFDSIGCGEARAAAVPGPAAAPRAVI